MEGRTRVLVSNNGIFEFGRCKSRDGFGFVYNKFNGFITHVE